MHTLDELFGGHFMTEVTDPYAVYARLRREEPVPFIDLPLQPGYLVTRYDDVVRVLKDAALFSSHANARGIGLVMGKTILEMDGREHTQHRNIVSLAFVPNALKGQLPATIAQIANAMVDRFATQGEAELVSQFTRTFPLRVIAHVIGIPIEDYETFKRWSLDVISFADNPGRGFESAGKLVEYLRPIVDLRRREPTHDLMSVLTHAEVDGHRLDDDEIFGFLRLLLPAGSDTTYRLIGNMLYALMHNPEQLEAVRADRSKIAWAIDETLRWESPVQLAARETTAPTTIAGVGIAEGAQILTGLGAANRDESHYPEPEKFDIERHPEDHVGFGFGRHFCLGSHLARLEATTAMNVLFDRLPNLRLRPDANAQIVGLAFRSPNRLPVQFDPA